MNNFRQTQKPNYDMAKTVIRATVIFALTLLTIWGVLEQNLNADSLFQSPAATSPIATPTPPPPAPTNTPPPAAPAEVQSAPTATIVVEATDEIQGGAAPQPESEQPEFTPTPPPVEANPLAPIVPQETEVVPVMPSEARPAVESSTPTGDRVINEAKLIDTLITWAARSMMCLGGVVLLALLIFLPLIYRRGKKLNQNNTD